MRSNRQSFVYVSARRMPEYLGDPDGVPPFLLNRNFEVRPYASVHKGHGLGGFQ